MYCYKIFVKYAHAAVKICLRSQYFRRPFICHKSYINLFSDIFHRLDKYGIIDEFKEIFFKLIFCIISFCSKFSIQANIRFSPSLFMNRNSAMNLFQFHTQTQILLQIRMMEYVLCFIV